MTCQKLQTLMTYQCHFFWLDVSFILHLFTSSTIIVRRLLPIYHTPNFNLRNLRQIKPKKCKLTCSFPPLVLNSSTLSSVLSSYVWGAHSHTTSSLPLIRRINKEQLAMFSILQAILVQFYTATIESILISAITIWFGAASSQEIRKLRRAVKMAKNIIGCDLPSLHDLGVFGMRRQTGRLIADTSHPANRLLQKLTSGRCCRSLITKTACNNES